jgi:hypothetical protein
MGVEVGKLALANLGTDNAELPKTMQKEKRGIIR